MLARYLNPENPTLVSIDNGALGLGTGSIDFLPIKLRSVCAS